jgi:hypothetical protein
MRNGRIKEWVKALIFGVVLKRRVHQRSRSYLLFSHQPFAGLVFEDMSLETHGFFDMTNVLATINHNSWKLHLVLRLRLA